MAIVTIIQHCWNAIRMWSDNLPSVIRCYNHDCTTDHNMGRSKATQVLPHSQVTIVTWKAVKTTRGVMDRMVKPSPCEKAWHMQGNSHPIPTNAGATALEDQNVLPDDQEFVHEVQPMRRRQATNQVSCDFILNISFYIDWIREHLSGRVASPQEKIFGDIDW